jgi:Rad3-related DNA helicase
MKGKIACSAQRLGLLEPDMIQSVVESNAFHIGKHYSAENRVRITDANDVHLISAVMGNSGLYEQAIQLRDGFLEARCTCTLSEQPLCRHGVAALLEYHRWQRSKARPAVKPQESGPPVVPAGKESSPSRSADVKLSELTVFIEWMQQAVRAIEKGQSVPDQPDAATGEIASWMRIIRNLDDRRREGEEIQVGLEAELQQRESALAQLTQRLEASLDESKSMQVACRDLRRELASQKTRLAKTGDLSRQFEELDAEIKTIAGDLAEKSAHLTCLADTVRQTTAALRAMDKPEPPE